MDKKHLSGAQKRKRAAEEKRKLNEQLKKIPKINEVFSGVASTSKSDEIASQRETEQHVESGHCDENITTEISTAPQEEIVEEQEGVVEGDVLGSEIGSDAETIDFEDREMSMNDFSSDITTSPHRDIESRSSSRAHFEFQTDVALWDIHGEISSLQRYWTKLGGLCYLFSFYECRFIVSIPPLAFQVPKNVKTSTPNFGRLQPVDISPPFTYAENLRMAQLLKEIGSFIHLRNNPYFVSRAGYTVITQVREMEFLQQPAIMIGKIVPVRLDTTNTQQLTRKTI